MSTLRDAITLPCFSKPILVGIATFCFMNAALVHGVDPMQMAKYSLAKRTTVRDCGIWKRSIATVEWEPERVAVIVCDVWDYHHSINAVRRLEEILPTMDACLRTMRSAGSIVIHAPSDCMPHYAEHPARQRAIAVPKGILPEGIASWNCQLERELASTYPLDQSDGGEDDDPEEHQAWAAKLSSLGRNPGLPWGAQNPAITIDPANDYISDRGDEVWAILKQHRIEHVVMIGVHTNMCVLGRPFGLRQLVKNGMDVVLVRDLTDCMYNPKRWPYVDHYSGNDLMIAYVEYGVCPTITSDQIVGGRAVMFSQDQRAARDLLPHRVSKQEKQRPTWELIEWKTIASKWLAPSPSPQGDDGNSEPGSRMLRCSLRVAPIAFEKSVVLQHPRIQRAWLNGHSLAQIDRAEGQRGFELRAEHTFGNDDANVLVIELDRSRSPQSPAGADAVSGPIVFVGGRGVTLGQHWQWNPEPTFSDTNLPLPAKFGLPPAIFYSVDLP